MKWILILALSAMSVTAIAKGEFKTLSELKGSEEVALHIRAWAVKTYPDDMERREFAKDEQAKAFFEIAKLLSELPEKESSELMGIIEKWKRSESDLDVSWFMALREWKAKKQ